MKTFLLDRYSNSYIPAAAIVRICPPRGMIRVWEVYTVDDRKYVLDPRQTGEDMVIEDIRLYFKLEV